MDDITAIELIQPSPPPLPERGATPPAAIPEGASSEDLPEEPEGSAPSPLPTDSGQALDLFA